MEPTEDAYRALARSSPWRWRTAHLTYADTDTVAEAWVRRPGQQLVRVAGRPDEIADERDRDRGGHALVSVRSPRSPVPRRCAVGLRRRPRRAAATLAPSWPHEVAPTLRADGLVAVRPSDHVVAYDDPMHESYTWVAMLDPVELSHHTDVVDVREDDRLGRRTWWARVSARGGYDPRCTCCPLLWSEVSARADAEASGDLAWRPPPGTSYPEAYDVALDVQTGIVVERSAIGPTSGVDGHALELHEVDADVSAVLGPDRG